MNREMIEGQWKQLKGSVQKQWGKLTDNDIDQMQGDYEKMVGKIQERYGVARDEAERQVKEWRH